jgi:hypothetical protein
MSESRWQVDKRVPVALVVTLFVQTAGAVWWASALDRRVFEVERRVLVLETAQTSANDAARQVNVVLARLEERLAAQTRTLERLERLAETAAGGPSPRPLDSR